MKLRELLQQLVAVQREIGVSTPYITGGTPRDKFMGRLDNIADIDITTGDKTVEYLSQEFSNQLRKSYNVIRKTMDDGHSTVFVGNLKIDFSSNFMAPNIDAHLKQMGIQNITDMQREMFSRDFTCNTLLLTMDLKKLLDPTHRGFKDIKEKKIRTCLSPEVTLTSNRNRVVRAIYLACKLGFDIDKPIIDFVRKNPESIKISTQKAMVEKLGQAFDKDPEKAAKIITEMGVWNLIPMSDEIYPYYMKNFGNKIKSKVAYFQGGGGVNEPEPKKKKYKSDPALVVQPRFKEPFYRNYDLYTIPGMEDIGPGAGWNEMSKYKSLEDFVKARRERLQSRYVADDSWQMDNGKRTKKNPNIQARAARFDQIVKQADDENDGPNFDYGKGLYSNMDKYKSVKDFEEHADKGPGAFFADDNADHMLPPKEHGTSIYDWHNSLYQGTPGKHKKDSNDIDFPVDEDINHDTLIRPEEGQYHPPKLVGPSGTDDLQTQPSYTGSENIQIEFTTPQIAGEHSYVPEHDFDGRSDDALNFGRDYDDESAPVGRTWDESFVDDLAAEMQEKEWDLDRLSAKYDDLDDMDMLNPAETEIYGLPDGVDPDAKDADKTIQNENPFTGILDSGRQMYEDKWNI